MSKKIDISAIERMAGQDAPLYHRHPKLDQPQPSYLEMDEDGTVSAYYSTEISHSSKPMHVAHGRSLRWRIPSNLSGAALVALVKPLYPLLERVCGGHTVQWSDGNRIGRLDEDAAQASGEIEDCLSAEEGDLDVWETPEWLLNDGLLDVWWPGAKGLDEAIEGIEAEARKTKVHLDGGIKKALLDEAQRLFDDLPPDEYPGKHLHRVHLDALLEEGRIKKEQHGEWVRAQAILHSLVNEPADIELQNKWILIALEANGWARGTGTAIASKAFATSNGRNVALAFLSTGDGINRTLIFQYDSEGRNVTEADGALIAVCATAKQASGIAYAAAARAERSILCSYGVRLAPQAPV